MKRTSLIFTCLLVTGFATGCTSTNGESAALSKLHANAQEQANKANLQAKVATQASQDYSYARRKEFIDKKKSDLSEIRDELEQLTVRLEDVDGEVRDSAKAKLAAAQDQWKQAKRQLDRAEVAGESSWDEVQGRFKKAHSELKDDVDSIRQWLSNKIAP